MQQPLTVWRVAQLSGSAKKVFFGDKFTAKKVGDVIRPLGQTYNAPSHHRKKAKLSKEPTSLYQMSLYPSKAQKKRMKMHVWTTAVTYDYCLWLIKERGVCPTNLYDMLNIPSSFFEAHDYHFFHSAAPSVKSLAVAHFLADYKTKSHLEYKNPRLGCFGSFDVQKGAIKQIGFSKLEITSNILSSKKKGDKRIKISKKHGKKMPDFTSDVRITYRCDGKFILNIPTTVKYTRKTSTVNNSPRGIASIDPGISTFASVFSTNDNSFYQVVTKEERDGIFGKWLEKLNHAFHRLNRLKEKGKTGQSLTDAHTHFLRMKLKIFHLAKNIHTKLAKWFVENYKVVVIGHYSPERRKHPIPSIEEWAHVLMPSRFRQTLKTRSRGTECEIYIVDESYTSKRCCSCGHLDWHLGASKVYKCCRCNMILDRDLNGAINILQKI